MRDSSSYKRNGKQDGPISRMEDGRYWCSNCMEPFEAADDLEPNECPKGHKADGSQPAEAF